MVASKCIPHRVQARDVTALSPGPALLRGLFKYPDALLTDVLKHPDCSSQLRSNFRRGPWFLRTHYSGMMTVEQSFHNLEKALRTHGLLQPPNTALVHSVEACDNSPLCHSIQNSMPRHLRPLHYFNNILDRLPQRVRDQRGKLNWPARQTVKANLKSARGQAAEAMAAASEILKDPSSFPSDAQAYCLRHGGQCPTMKYLGMQSGGYWCQCWAGPDCFDPNAIGTRPGFASPSTIPMLTWCHERRFKLETVIATECAPGWSTEALDTALVETHSTHRMLICPRDFGWPIGRLRLYIVSTRNDHITMSCTSHEFCEKLGWFKMCMLLGSSLSAEDADIVHAEKLRLAAAMGCLPHDATWESSLIGAQLVRLDAFRKKEPGI